MIFLYSGNLSDLKNIDFSIILDPEVDSYLQYK